MSIFRVDKGSKLLIGTLAARKYNPEYVLIFDADDFVGNDISAYVNAHPGENGWIMPSVYKMTGNKIVPIDSRYTICGTGNIFNFSLLMEDISPDVSEESTQDELFEQVDSKFLMFILGSHRHARLYYEEKGRPFQSAFEKSGLVKWRWKANHLTKPEGTIVAQTASIHKRLNR